MIIYLFIFYLWLSNGFLDKAPNQEWQKEHKDVLDCNKIENFCAAKPYFR